MTAAADLWNEIEEVQRDRWGRPYIIPPGGGKPIGYTRVSTLAKTLDDTTALTDWKVRQTILGLCQREDLMALARSCGPDDRRTLRDVAGQAMDAAQSSSGRNNGTAIHSFAEQLDKGAVPNVPPEFAADIEAYRKATSVVTVVAMERLVVIDELKAAGSFDRLVRMPDGRTVIADIKTGKDAPKYANTTAAQMACYAHGQLYDVRAGDRSPLPGPIDLTFGLLYYLPAGAGRCEVHRVDLEFGWELAKDSVKARKSRAFKSASLMWSADA